MFGIGELSVYIVSEACNLKHFFFSVSFSFLFTLKLSYGKSQKRTKKKKTP